MLNSWELHKLIMNCVYIEKGRGGHTKTLDNSKSAIEGESKRLFRKLSGKQEV